jgi:hypothetical protein
MAIMMAALVGAGMWAAVRGRRVRAASGRSRHEAGHPAVTRPAGRADSALIHWLRRPAGAAAWSALDCSVARGPSGPSDT